MIRLFSSGGTTHKIDDVVSITVPVLGQHGTTHGADTCGFHSLKNALLCIHTAYHVDDNLVGNETKEKLRSVSFYENLYLRWSTYVPKSQRGFDASIAILVDILDDYQSGKLSFSPVVDRLLASGWTKYITVSTLNLSGSERHFLTAGGSRFLLSLGHLYTVSNISTRHFHAYVVGTNSGNSSGHYTTACLEIFPTYKGWLMMNSMGGGCCDVVRTLNSKLWPLDRESIIKAYDNLIGTTLDAREQYFQPNGKLKKEDYVENHSIIRSKQWTEDLKNISIFMRRTRWGAYAKNTEERKLYDQFLFLIRATHGLHGLPNTLE